MPRSSVLALLLFASTLTVMAGSTIAPVLEVIRGDLAVSGTAAGLIITAHGLAIAVSSPLMGRLIDRWGFCRPLAGGLLLYGIAGAAGIFVTTYPALIASRLLFGVGAAAVFSGTTVALLELYRGPERDRVMGWRGSVTSAGGVVWPLLSGALGGISWHASFGAYLIGVPLGLLSLRLLPRAERRDVGGPREGQAGMVRLLRTYPALLVWCGLFLVSMVFMYALAVFLPQRLAQVGVEVPFLVSLYTVAASLLATVAGLAYARVRARLGYGSLLRVSAVSWVAAFLILGLSGWPPLMLLAPALVGLGQGLSMPALTVLMGEGVPAAQRGRATALSSTALFAGQFVSPLLFGPLMAATSVTTGYLIAAAAAALLVAGLTALRVTDPEQPRDGAPKPSKPSAPVVGAATRQ
ncbi:MFS transporter [Streptomyces sp. MAR4 CNY-716]